MLLPKFDIVRKTPGNRQGVKIVTHTINQEQAARAFIHLRNLDPKMSHSKIYEIIAKEARRRGAVRMFHGGFIKTRIEKLVNGLLVDEAYKKKALLEVQHSIANHEVVRKKRVMRRGRSTTLSLFNSVNAAKAFFSIKREYPELPDNQIYLVVAKQANQTGVSKITAKFVRDKIRRDVDDYYKRKEKKPTAVRRD